MEIQILMKGHPCYTTRDNAEVTLWHSVVVVTVSNYKHQPCIHKYWDLNYWWMAVAWYLKDQVKSNWVFKNLATRVLCYVKIWMTVDQPSTAELY